MSKYTLSFAHAARKELENLDASIVKRVFPKIEALTGQPRPTGCRKLVGEENLWRIRVGDYRDIYSVDDASEVVDIVAVRHRSKAYE